MRGPRHEGRRSSRAELADCWGEHRLPALRKPPRFEYLPVGLFASVMGLAGLGIAWRRATSLLGVPVSLANGMMALSAAVFLVLAGVYLTKAVSAPDRVRDEFRHPVTGNLFATIPISVLLIAAAIAPHLRTVALVIWCIGTAGALGFAWLTIDRWMEGRRKVEDATPVWLVPVVGLLNVPLAVPLLDLPEARPLMSACVAVGLFLAIPLFTLVLSRLILGEPMPDQQQATLLILVAPFAVGYSAYVATAGHVDGFAEALLGIMVFLMTVLLGRLRHLVTCCPFRIGWWAAGFPLAAAANAALAYTQARPGTLTVAVSIALLAIATTVIAGLFIRTALGIARGDLRSLV